MDRFDPTSLDRLLAPADDGLDDARSFLRRLLETTPLGVSVQTVDVDDDGRVVAVVDDMGPELARRVGRRDASTDEELERQGAGSDDEGRTSLRARVEQQWERGGGVVTGEVEVDRPDGTVVVSDVATHVFPDRRRVISYSLDVTGRTTTERQLAEHRELLGSILQGSPDLVAVTDLEGVVRFASHALLGLAGLDPDDLQGRHTSDLLDPDDVPQMMAVFADLLAGRAKVAAVRARLRRADGTFLPLDARTTPLRDPQGELQGFVTVGRDATPDILMEQILSDARDEAERANAAKDVFLSRMSHELRTPLNAVLGFAQLLEHGELGARDRDSVAHIRLAGAHLLRLLDEVLDLTRIESGTFRVELAPVRLRGALDEALTYIEPLAREQGIAIEAPPDVGEWARADRPRLVQVLLNLLSNAVKFNRRGGTVTIDFEHAGADHWAIAVRDTGRGLRPDELSRLFVPFERLDADERGVTGSGIGLALSKSLVEQMEGSLTAESTVGAGSTFTITLPATEPEEVITAGDGEPLAPGEPVSSSLVILYVEDNTTNRDLIRHTIARAGLDRLLVATTGMEGVETALAERPDLVLLDLHLPDIDGVEVMWRIRADAALATVPVVVVSADATRRQISRVLDAGADAYLTKPLQIAELLATIDRYRPT